MTNKDAIYFLNLLQSKCDNGYETQAIYLAVKALEPRPQGEWKIAENQGWFSDIYICSCCGNTLDFRGVNGGRGSGNFCPNCGADMRVKEDRE